MFIKKHFRKPAFFILLFAVFISVSQTSAQERTEEDKFVDVEVSTSTSTVAAGQELKLTIRLKLGEGMHANSDSPNDLYLIPTSFRPEKITNISWGKVVYPASSEVNEWYSDEPLSVFEDGAEIVVPLKVESAATAGNMKIGGKLRVQVCDQEKCYPAKNIPAYTQITVNDKKSAANPVTSDKSKILIKENEKSSLLSAKGIK